MHSTAKVPTFSHSSTHECLFWHSLNFMSVCRLSGGLMRWWNRCVRGTL
jgi:hypothetical protein